MRLWIVGWALALAWAACSTSPATSSQQGRSATPADRATRTAPAHRQVLAVITPDWEQAAGHLYRLAWQDTAWQLVGEPIPVLIGRNGLGWGIGLADYRDRPGPAKQEGDLKSPAGIFALETAFGYAPQADFIRMPYAHVSETLMCIEDTSSRAYNRIVDEATVQADWNSTDHMRRDDDLYEWGMLVAHNYDPALPGQGSCIFLHAWREGGRGTAGCTSLDKEHLRQVLAWLDPAAQPVLLQAPHTALADLAASLALPSDWRERWQADH